MKTNRLPIALSLIAAVNLLGFAVSPALGHDRDEEHHHYDHVRANELSHHAYQDNQHATRAMERAFETGDLRDFYHALSDINHTNRAERSAYDAQEHASNHGKRRHHHND